MEFHPITDYALFHSLLTEYYRDGADADTPQEEIDGVIRYLYDLYTQNAISGCIAWEGEPVGFALWQLDTADSPFSQCPGWGIPYWKLELYPNSGGKATASRWCAMQKMPYRLKTATSVPMARQRASGKNAATGIRGSWRPMD